MHLVSPFDRLRSLLADLDPGAPVVDLSLGSPRTPPPPIVAEVIARHAGGWGAYPPIAGTPNFLRAVQDWLDRRYGLDGFFREAGGVLPASGSREALVLAAFPARDRVVKARPAVLFANPFYAAYPAAAQAAGAEPVPLAAREPGSVVPDWDQVPAATLDRAVAYYIGSPANPSGAVASLADWHEIFDRAERHDFVVLADECYSELYRATGPAPIGALEAARERPDILDRLVVFNSLSKRSGLAGLRVGFIAAGRRLTTAIRDFRNTVAPHVPVPLMEAAAAAYDDEVHVAANRALYDAAFAGAERALAPLFGPVTPPGGFFLWLDVGDDEAVARTLWAEAGVRTLPGRYLAFDGAAGNPGRGRLRVALVDAPEKCAAAAERIAALLARHEGAASLAIAH